jgi:hypothetical protein
MPDYAATQQARDVPGPPIEPVSAVNQNTIGLLVDSDNSLSQLLSKVRGSQPEGVKGEGNIAKMPERHILGDARALRELAGRIYEKAQELHRYIGHDK